MNPVQMTNAILSPTQPVVRTVVDDSPEGIVVMYIGTEVSATITVSSSGDITFKHGALAAEAVDATIDSGGDDAGVIDVSDSNANTFGEVLDIINGSANWKAYLKDALRADNSNNSTGSLLIRSETTLTPNVTETPLFVDTSKTLEMSVRIGSRTKVNGVEYASAAEAISIVHLNTYGSGTSKIRVYEVDEIRKTETKIYDIAGASTATQGDGIQNASSNTTIKKITTSRTGMHLLVRMIGQSFCTGYLNVFGNVMRGS